MRAILKHIVARTYKPLLEKYLSKTRTYQYEDIRLDVAPEVFHPGFFFSTHMLLKYLKKLPLEKKLFLELGCGSGLISIYAAKKGAMVTATDINETALLFLAKNSRFNNTALRIIKSDLFHDISEQAFDIIAINPPYYKKQPQSFEDYAWFCGENGEYFEQLFAGLKNYMHSETMVLMVLCDGCDIEMVERLARENGCSMQAIYTKKNMLETNFIYRIQLRK